MKKFNFFIFVFLFIFVSGLYSHHTMEYISMESYNTLKQGAFSIHLHYDYMVEDSNDPAQDHWEFTPGISFGITDRLMFDAHTHLAKFNVGLLKSDKQAAYSPLGPSPFIEAIALSVQYRILERSFVDLALAVIYEFPMKRSIDLLGGNRVFESVLIVSKNLGSHRNVTINLKYGRDGREDFLEWAVGAKTPLTKDAHGISMGLEIMGDFKEAWSLLPGIYFPLGGLNTFLKTGIEFSLNGLHPNITLLYLF